MYNSPSDQKVDPDSGFVELAQNGNVLGLQTLYGKYFDPIYRCCYWQTGSAEDAEDLTQEVFIAMTKSIKNFKGKALFKNWLYQIAKYHIIHWIQRKKELQQQPLFESLADTEEWIDPENEQIKNRLIQEAFKLLTSDEKEVISLRYLKNYTIKETAQTLSISESNVKVITHRSLKKLQQKLPLPPKL
jgi:RNA polymerase sigma-70 factor (ECF subfamily)